MTPDRRDFSRRSAAVVSAVMIADGTEALGVDEGPVVPTPRTLVSGGCATGTIRTVAS